MKNIITAIAFERNAGGYRARVLDKRDQQIHESPILDTIKAARNWARSKALDLAGEQSYRLGYCYKPWTMCVWVRE